MGNNSIGAIIESLSFLASSSGVPNMSAEEPTPAASKSGSFRKSQPPPCFDGRNQSDFVISWFVLVLQPEQPLLRLGVA